MSFEDQCVVESVYFETIAEAFERGASVLSAHIEGVTAAAMMLSCLTEIEAEPARRAVVALGLRP